MNKLLKTSIEAAIESGKVILEIYDSDELELELKGDNSPLTKADKVSHNILVSHLKKTGIPILSEEGKKISYSERKYWKKLWIIDPIDGTKEFIKRNGEFTVNIALVESQRSVLGVVFAPALGDLYFSTSELGSFKVKVDFKNLNLDNLVGAAEKLPFERNDKTFSIVASRSHMSPETEDFIAEMKEKHGEVKLISKGSSLKLCMVAEGKADCYPRFAHTMEWDTAAGQAVCEYAGFQVIDLITKEPMLYNRTKLLNNWFLVK
jgi:3'(2'), 5'-bisphosphate nucleotidase